MDCCLSILHLWSQKKNSSGWRMGGCSLLYTTSKGRPVCRFSRCVERILDVDPLRGYRRRRNLPSVVVGEGAGKKTSSVPRQSSHGGSPAAPISTSIPSSSRYASGSSIISPCPKWLSKASASWRSASASVSPKEATPESICRAVTRPSSSWTNSTPAGGFGA